MGRRRQEQTATAKCGGLSTTAAKAPPPVEMTSVLGGVGRTGNGNGYSVRGVGLFGPAAEDEGAVGAAEAEGVGEGVVDLGGLGRVGDVVEAALGVELDDVHGGRSDLVEHGHDGDAGFEAAGAAEQVAGHGLGGADERVRGRVRVRRRRSRWPWTPGRRRAGWRWRGR